MKKCIKCGVELIDRGRAAKFCESCRIIRNKELDRQSELRKQQKRKDATGDKFCGRCNIKIESNNRVKYCLKCRPIMEKQRVLEGKRRRSTIRRRKDRKELTANFKNLNPSGKYLIPAHFDNISDISSKTYLQKMSGGWVSILKRHNKFDELKAYILEEYIRWSHKVGSQVVSEFCKYIGISVSLMDKFYLGNELRVLAGYEKFSNYTDKEVKNEFNRVLELFEYVPLWNEFIDNSKISLYTMAKRHNFTGNVYVQLLEHYGIPKIEINNMISRQKLINAERNSMLHTGRYAVSMESLEKDFKETFDAFIDQYGVSPCYEDYIKLSKHNIKTITRRLGMTYTEIARYYGYEIDTSGSIAEKMTLNLISKILQEDYISQAKFDWLRSELNRNLFCDGYYSNHKIIVEYDGEQHFRPVEYFGGEKGFARIQSNDAIKNKLIPQHNLTLIRITYNEPYWDEEFLKQKLIENGINIPNNTINNNIA